MAMQDYFIPCYKLETKTVSDGLGGFETVEYVGIAFNGLPVKKGDTEQLVGALRGSAYTQYNFHCPSNVPLKKDDRIMYEEDGEKRYIRLSSEPHINTERSLQTEWKTYEAETYNPASLVRGD